MADVKIVHIPHKGSAPGTVATIAGETDLMLSNILPAVQAINSKRLRALAITSRKRSSILPAVPTVAESGLAGFDVETLYGLLAPTGTPSDIVSRLNASLVKGFTSPDVRKLLASDGSEAMTSSPDEFTKTIKEETAKWAKVIKDAGIVPE